MEQDRFDVGLETVCSVPSPCLASEPDSSLGQVEPVFATMVYKM